MKDVNDLRSPQRLIDLLAEQRGLYVRLRELSEQQRTLITGDRPEMLLNILRERQSLVAALARLNDELAPYRRDWENLYSGLPDDLRRQANDLLQEINGLLRVILRTDQEDSALLSARKQTLGGEMDKLSGGHSANSAYARQATPEKRGPSADVTG
ncbi:MAG: flagellar export chaperone FlgN [Phycisphaerae bacterium]|jgi:flagellar biosynthesis/type III secretory pathway chaperone